MKNGFRPMFGQFVQLGWHCQFDQFRGGLFGEFGQRRGECGCSSCPQSKFVFDLIGALFDPNWCLFDQIGLGSTNIRELVRQDSARFGLRFDKTWQDSANLARCGQGVDRFGVGLGSSRLGLGSTKLVQLSLGASARTAEKWRAQNLFRLACGAGRKRWRLQGP